MKKLLVLILTLPIKGYQKLISPLLGPKCIYYPSCSNYCIESLKKHGPITGLLYGLLRIFRCSPLFKGGSDPVQDETTIKKELSKYRYFVRSRKR